MRRILYLLALLAAPAAALVPEDAPALPDFDARGQRLAVAAPVTPRQSKALDRVLAESPSGRELVFVAGPSSGTLHLLFRRGGFLAGPAEGTAQDVALGWIVRHRELLGLSAAAVRGLRAAHVVEDPGTLARHAYFEESVGGVPIFHGEVRVAMDRHGRVLSVAGNTERDAIASGAERLDARAALQAAARWAGVATEAPALAASEDASGLFRFERGPFASEPWAHRAWFPTDAGLLRAWVVTVDPPKDRGWYQVVVDAGTGALLHRFDLVESAATEGLVFREDPGQGPQIVAPFVDDAAYTDPATPMGWSGAGLTQGNNCDVKDDIANDDEGSDGRRATAAPGPPASFSFPFTDDTSQDLDASLTNLFWLNNWLHDRLVRMGFDEASGNFQQVNVSGEGRGGDPVLVDAQDGSGRNNANFGTPPDGFPPRMQMYVWTYTNPWRDSGFDASVVTHELFHGVSNRLVGLAANDAGCLGGPQGGAMGEAWSDFFACSFWNVPTVGGYLVDDYVRGIRRAAYDAYPYDYGELCNQGGFQVHRDGEIWAATLWDLRAALIAKYGHERGRCLAHRLVLDGMKLAPCAPTYVDMRDAILLAAQLRGDDGDACLLWNAFAGRGLGVAATARPDCTNASDTSFLAPAECASCALFAAPTSVTIDASQPNRVTATFTPSPGATAHVLLRAPGPCPDDCAEAPFEEVARGDGSATSLSVGDTPSDPMSSGARFAFRVVALDGACSASSPCAIAQVTGRCTLPPVAASDDAPLGVVTLARPPQATCVVDVSWNAARAACAQPGAVRYNVYRSGDPAFTPGPEWLVASVMAPATSWRDASPPYAESTYVVRAEDMTIGGAGPHGGNEEDNVVRLSLRPQGTLTGTTSFSDDAESGELPGYRRTGTFPVNDWGVVADANTRGGQAWHCTDVEGGNADKNLHLPLLSLGAAPRLRFRHAFWVEDAFDGGVIEISVDGGRTWRDLVDDVAAGGYATSMGAGFSYTVGDMIHPPNDNRLWTGQNASGFPSYDDVDVDLAPYAGTLDAQLRFRTLVDALAAEPGGWYLDDIVVDDVQSFGACSWACAGPPTAALADASGCEPGSAPTFVPLDASASAPGATPLAGDLPIVLTHDGPGSFAGRRWAAGPQATLEFPPGTPAGTYPVTVTVRGADGCASTATATVTLTAESVVPPPVGPTLRVARAGSALRLTWTDVGAPAYNACVAPFGSDLTALVSGLIPPVSRPAASPLALGGGLAAPGAGSAFIQVFSSSDCGRSVP